MSEQQNNSAARDGPPAKLPMDIEHLKSLIALMIDNDLSRMELREGDSHILLRRGQPLGAAAPVVQVASPSLAGAPASAPGTAGAAPDAVDNQESLIRSPMVGTFYAAADPESLPFVNVGSLVDPSTVVCLIEAMKVFNELKAEVSGRITKVLVKNAEAVEFDQPLFAVVPA
jgi:acetyl-CoA carboxylase biotin carboxyl carrier protein